MVKTGEFYAGSRLLTPLSETIGLPIDQVNFLVCQLVALILAFPFRIVLSPSTTSLTVRHVVQITLGVSLTLFCFGYQIWHLFMLSFVSYILMKYGSKDWMHNAIFIYNMVYLSVTHIWRQIYDYGGYTLDITGPLMIMTQKMSSMAFSLHDGLYKDNNKLTQDQKSQAIRKMPSLLSFYSYVFYFHGIMCGPLCFFADFISFMEGRNFMEAKIPYIENSTNKQLVLLSCLVLLFICLVLLLICLLFLISAQSFFEMSFIQKTVYLLICLMLAKQKYYFAWKLGEAVNNAAGLGFQGFDEKGQPKWDLVNNVDIWNVEFCNSLKLNLDAWNKTTLVWLRRVVYDRVPKLKVVAVFVCSATWHGFYPGYYLTFATGLLLTVAAKLVRRKIRPFFLTSPVLKFIYDCSTFIFTRLALMWLATPFILLELKPGLTVYSSLYWWLHILSMVAIVILSFYHPQKPKPDSDKKAETDKKTQ
ncbi:hypothetical protein LOTGIDRAFT_129765 [Lottia gigantea]|uniref:Uncharacterized protein n=1 Tax=Lottia gigantea TaxID=225164 RepID=V3ZYM2_LOTGI|nr:hypothetical protein LOTGIDRAFT_129765 [Lottia gigantea]ESO86086.1 hypothetical protein LOTGIDRAFT_129765 [Lottia gigantea]